MKVKQKFNVEIEVETYPIGSKVVTHHCENGYRKAVVTNVKVIPCPAYVIRLVYEFESEGKTFSTDCINHGIVFSFCQYNLAYGKKLLEYDPNIEYEFIQVDGSICNPKCIIGDTMVLINGELFQKHLFNEEQLNRLATNPVISELTDYNEFDEYVYYIEFEDESLDFTIVI